MSIIDTLLGAGGTLTIVSTGGLVARQWLRNRKHARANAAMVERTDREADAQEHVADVAAQAAVTVEALRQVPQLIENVRTLMAEAGECKETLVKERGERQQERVDDAEACRKETARQVREAEARVRADLGIVAARVRDSLDMDSTGVHALDRIVRKSPTPPEPMQAQPERREPPPPPRRREERSDAAALLPLAIAVHEVLTDDGPSDDGQGD